MIEETAKKAAAILEGLREDARGEEVKMLNLACEALAELTSARKEEREAGKRKVRSWRTGLIEFR